MRRIRLMLLSAVVAVAVALPAPVLASGGSVTVGPVTLTNRVLVTVPITLICDPIEGATNPSLSGMPGSSVTIRQAVGKTVATASADLYAHVTCDGVFENVLMVQLWASDVPFHGGQAVLEAQIRVTDPYVWPEPEGFRADITQVIKFKHG